jgi:crossover junction endodeoxyribonuclease RuvC
MKPSTQRPTRIVGIDPGSVICGFGVIDVHGGKLSLVEYGVVDVKRQHTSFPERLCEIHSRLGAVMDRTQPDQCSMETVFHGKNVLTIVQLAQARGVAMLAAAQRNLMPTEYTPMQIKRAVTGRGSASKDYVRHMVHAMLDITDNHKFLDATDALAVAICHALLGGRPLPARTTAQRRGKRSAWADFVEKNPDKIR